jgi:uncharacterized membrane protein
MTLLVILLAALLGFVVWGVTSLRTRLSLLELEVEDLRRKLELSAPAVPPGKTAREEPFTRAHDAYSGERELHAEPGARIPDGAISPSLPEWNPEWIGDTAAPPPPGDARKDSRRNSGWSLPDSLTGFLSGGSLLVKTGVIILFFGVSFLVKYAADHALLPIELRLSGAALAGILLLAVGWRLRRGRPLYAHALQGGGVGVLYLTIFAAFRLYNLLPPLFVFSLLVAVAVISAVLAVLQDSRSLAVLGASGGFLAPVLASTGSGSHVVLFSYYALLNLGIAGIAWFRAWRILNLMGFAFTFVIGVSWGWRYYRPDYFTTTEPFLILFFLIYTFVAVLFALRQSPDLKGYLDGTLVFGTPIAAFALQAMLVEPYRFALAWSAVALGLFYLPLAMLLFRKRPLSMRTLTEAFFAFGVIFGTLAIPLALENRWTSAAWALEGAAILWAGLRQQRRLARAFGILLQFGAGISFLADLHSSTGTIPVLNGHFLGCALIALTGIFSACCLQRHRESVSRAETFFSPLLLAWGLLWWLSGGLGEIDRHVATAYTMGAILAFLALSCLACDLARKRLDWPAMIWPALALLPMLYLCVLAMAGRGIHPLAEGGLAGWPAAFAVAYLLLHRHDSMHPRLGNLLHAGTLWLAAGLLTLESAWRLDQWVAGSPVWPLVAFGLVPAGTVLLTATMGARLSWPTGRHLDTYLSLGSGPLALFAWLWIWYANLASPGDASPLRYLPLLNPLDLATGFVLVALPVLEQHLRETFPDIFTKPLVRRLFLSCFSATVFLWLNGVVVRTVHHWGGVAFSLSALHHSLLLQATLSIFWSLLALCAMSYAARLGSRYVWFSGAALLGTVVLKLFIVDLSGIGTVSRIVSFVGVGVLLLVIGYFAPVPPGGRGEGAA